MNQQKTAKMELGFVRILLLAVAILIVCTGSALAQESLYDVAKEYGVDWVFGQWIATTDEGTEIHLAYKLELNGHLVSVSLEMEQYALRGMIFYKPSEESAIQVSVDNMGRMTEGKWELMGDKLIWKNEFVDDMGDKQKIAIVYSKVDAQTMKIEIYGVDEDGLLSDEPRASLEFKREVSKKE